MKHVLHRGTHWRNLANTIQPSMSGGDADFCQITLTACSAFQYFWSILSHYSIAILFFSGQILTQLRILIAMIYRQTAQYFEMMMFLCLAK